LAKVDRSLQIPGLSVPPATEQRIAYRTLGGKAIAVDGAPLDEWAHLDEPFAGQPQSETHQRLPRKTDAPATWIERVYKTVGGKQYGPYYYERWRDEKGVKRSKYRGKTIGDTDGDG
jgi:hypothetical protein